MKWSWPTNSSTDRGRIRAASGCAWRRFASWMSWKRSMGASLSNHHIVRPFRPWEIRLRLGRAAPLAGRRDVGAGVVRLEQTAAFVAGQILENHAHILVALFLLSGHHPR